MIYYWHKFSFARSDIILIITILAQLWQRDRATSSHINIPGNEKADAATKSALSFPITNMKLPAYDLIPLVSKFCFEEWHAIWNCCPSNKLHAIYPVVGTAQHNKIRSRHEVVIINRLRLGHCHLTHSYLMSGDDQPVCESCRLLLTVKHILANCLNL